MLAPICWAMLIDDRVASVAGDEQRAIGRAGRDGAEIRRRGCVAPFVILHRRVARSRPTLFQSPDASARCCRPDSANRPTGRMVFWALSASETSTTVRPAAVSLRGIEDHLDLAGVARLHFDGAGAGHARDSGFTTKFA